MARDYKKRTPTRRNNKAGSPVWVWMLVGFVLGALSMGLIWLKFSAEPEPRWVNNKKPASETTPEISQEVSKAVRPPTFDFYDLLPEMEVVIPSDELETQPLSTREEEKVKKEKVRYLLQVGSFRTTQDADKLKASLALLGFQAELEKSQSGSQTWHRVRVGPFISSQALKHAKGLLTKNGHDSLAIKVK